MKKQSVLPIRIDFFVLDLICVEFSFVLAYRFKFAEWNPFASGTWSSIAIMIALTDSLCMLLGPFLEGIRRRGNLKELLSILVQTFVWEALVALYLYAVHEGIRYSRTVVFVTGVIYLIFNFWIRFFWKKVLFRLRSQHKQQYILVGQSDELNQFEQYISSDIIRHAVVTAKLTMQNSGDLAELEQYLANGSIDEVVAYFTVDRSAEMNKVIGLCEKYGVHFSLIPFFCREISSAATIETVDNIKLINFRTTPLDNANNAVFKRAFDIVGSLILIILTSPVMLIAAIGTALSGPGPILFKQQRVGKKRKLFTMLKFRSMRVTDTEDSGWSTADDPRKTRFGAFIRKFSIDELPQFFNVLAGQMSLIGPRPEVPYHVDHFMNEIPLYLVRQRVRPGMTGWAQVNGFRGDTSIEKRVRYDIWYIENWSISLDLRILFMTVFGGMINREKIK